MAGTLFWTFLLVIPAVGIPLACAVAVLKHRLQEIDRIISRTLACAIVTGLSVASCPDACETILTWAMTACLPGS